MSNDTNHSHSDGHRAQETTAPARSSWKKAAVIGVSRRRQADGASALRW